MACIQFSTALVSFLNPIIISTILLVTEGYILLYFVGLLFSISPLYALFGARNEAVIYRAYFIGVVCTIGIFTIYYTSHIQLGIYLIGLSFFHISEYLLTAFYKPDKLSNDSFLLNHSTAYHAALVLSLFEYMVEYVNIGDDKFKWNIISILGGVLMASGDVFRKVAMATAAENFDHIVQTVKKQEHKLVTHGVYSISRHPSYMGWFYWSIGSQLLLCNPVCVVGYAYASWTFFNERIEEEECYLIGFFGKDYLKYCDKVGIGIPFIKGYEINPDFLEFLEEANRNRLND